jgi:large exoprotein involved in heme utilization and adhesion
VSTAARDAGVTMTPGGRVGRVELTQGSTLDTSGDGGGTIIIRSGTLLVDQSRMSADTLGVRPGAAIGLDVQVTEAAVLTRGSSLTTNVGGAGRAGDIRITTGSLELREGAVLGSSTFENTTGDSGHITITTGRLQLPGRGGTSSDPISPISTETRGTGNAGDIVVQAREVVLSEGAQISGTTFGPGRGGGVSVRATETLTLRGTTPEGSSGIFARTEGSGDAGKVEVQARDIMLSDGATISSSTLGAGQGGTVTVRATETLTMQGASIVFANAGSGFRPAAVTGAAGTVEVQARDIMLSDASQIASATFGPGSGGRVTVTATETLTLRGTTPNGNFSTGVFGNTQGTMAGAGAAGTVQVQARDIMLGHGARIASTTSGPGSGVG